MSIGHCENCINLHFEKVIYYFLNTSKMKKKLSNNYYDTSKIDEFTFDYIDFLNKYKENGIGN